MEFLNREGSDSVTKFITYTYANIKQDGLTFFRKCIQSFCNAPKLSKDIFVNYRISSYSFRPWIVSSLEYFSRQKFSLLGKKLKIAATLNFLQFPNSKKKIVSTELIWGNTVFINISGSYVTMWQRYLRKDFNPLCQECAVKLQRKQTQKVFEIKLRRHDALL